MYQIDWDIPLDCISKEALLERMKGDSSFVVVDTVGTYDGNRFKIKGAKTIPYPEVIDRRNELMNYDEVIIYCKNRKCKASKKVASALKMLNVKNVKVYEGGIDEWVQHGLPVSEYGEPSPG